MNKLTKLAFENLYFLVDLKHNDIILSNRRNFYKQQEYVQVNNIHELEHTLYFTFMHLLYHPHNYETNFKELLNNIDLAIDNIYENEFLHKIIQENHEFLMIIKDIDHSFQRVKNEQIQKNICSKMLDRFVIFSERIGDFMKVSHLVLNEYQGISDDDDNNDDTCKGTGEHNPNLIYEDDDIDDDKKEC